MREAGMKQRGMRDETATATPFLSPLKRGNTRGSAVDLRCLIPHPFLSPSSLIPFLILVSSLISHPSSLAHAAFEFRQTGARAVGMGGAFTAQSTDATAPFWNPAGVRMVPQVEVTSFYTQFFSLSALRYLGASFAVPTPFGGIGAGTVSSVRRNTANSSSRHPRVRTGGQCFCRYTLKGCPLKLDSVQHPRSVWTCVGAYNRKSESGNHGKNVNRPAIGVAKDCSHRICRGCSVQTHRRFVADRRL